MSAANPIFQIKIALVGIRPPIWRRVLVAPTITLEELHDVIQAAMGWDDSHLHLFDVNGTIYALPYDEPLESRQRDERNVPLKRVLPREGAKMVYEYDYGDSWRHTITLEKKLPFDSGLTYPIVVAGKRACPPEDCGGAWGYATILQALSGEDVEDKESLLEWYSADFDPEAFDMAAVNARIWVSNRDSLGTFENIACGGAP